MKSDFNKLSHPRFLIVVVFMIFLASVACEKTGTGTTEDQIDPVVSEVLSSSDDSALPDTLQEAYWEDAARLVMRMISETGGSLMTEVELPTDSVSTIYHALVRVYNATALAARDTIVQIHPIHTFPFPTLHNLMVKVDTTYSWVIAWQSGQSLTGNAEIDTLMVRYQLELVSFSQVMSQTLALISSLDPLNITALADRFKDIDGVINASPSNPSGDENDITSSDITDQFVQLDFSLGWTFYIGDGGHPYWNKYHRYWRFRAFADNRVQFVKSWGTPLPNP